MGVLWQGVKSGRRKFGVRLSQTLKRSEIQMEEV
jgi:hypothetical protein